MKFIKTEIPDLFIIEPSWTGGKINYFTMYGKKIYRKLEG